MTGIEKGIVRVVRTFYPTIYTDIGKKQESAWLEISKKVSSSLKLKSINGKNNILGNFFNF